uniref:Transmembrane protein 266 n=1 Tax=Salmo trutta TaxID=8032 RepID=A0A674E724_SALTR
MANPHDVVEQQAGGLSDLEIISQPDPVEEHSVPEMNPSCMAPVQLVSFGYRDLPLAHLDFSLAGSQLLSNLDEDDNREGSNWLKPCCGRRVALWQVCLLSAGFNCFLVALVILVVVFLTLELLIDTKHLQFANAIQFASVIHWISLAILSLFFTEVFDGAVIVLSLAPMVASTVANGPSSPWDAISLIITLRIWRVKRIIDAYVLQVKVEMELEILQCEKIKAVREEQLERLTQICQEQAFEIRQLRAHLAQQDLDLAAEQEAAMQIHHVWSKQRTSYQVVEGQGPGESDDEGHGVLRETPADPVVHHDDMNNYISQYYSEPSSDVEGPRVITMAAIDVHLPKTHYPAHNNPLLGVEQMSSAVSDTSTSVSRSSGSLTARPHSLSSHTLRSSTTDCSSSTTARDYHTQARNYNSHTKARGPYLDYKSQKQTQDRDFNTEHYNTQGQRCFPLPYCSPLGLGLTSAQPPLPQDPSVVVQELLSSLSEDSCLAQKGLVDPVNLKLPSPAGSAKASPELEHRINIYNWKNREENQYQSRGQRQGRAAATVLLQTKPLIHLQGGAPESSLEEKYRLLGPADGPLGRLPDT